MNHLAPLYTTQQSSATGHEFPHATTAQQHIIGASLQQGYPFLFSGLIWQQQQGRACIPSPKSLYQGHGGLNIGERTRHVDNQQLNVLNGGARFQQLTHLGGVSHGVNLETLLLQSLRQGRAPRRIMGHQQQLRGCGCRHQRREGRWLITSARLALICNHPSSRSSPSRRVTVTRVVLRALARS